jgi:hypothetical protein
MSLSNALSWLKKKLMRQTQQYLKKKNINDNLNGSYLQPKISESLSIFERQVWLTRVTWWTFLVLLDLSCQECFYDIGDVIIKVFVCLWNLLFFFSSPTYLIFFYWISLFKITINYKYYISQSLHFMYEIQGC